MGLPTITLFVWWLLSRGTLILAGSIGVARFCGVFLFCFFALVNRLFQVSAICLARDRARCRAALGAKKSMKSRITCRHLGREAASAVRRRKSLRLVRLFADVLDLLERAMNRTRDDLRAGWPKPILLNGEGKIRSLARSVTGGSGSLEGESKLMALPQNFGRSVFS